MPKDINIFKESKKAVKKFLDEDVEKCGAHRFKVMFQPPYGITLIPKCGFFTRADFVALEKWLVTYNPGHFNDGMDMMYHVKDNRLSLCTLIETD